MVSDNIYGGFSFRIAIGKTLLVIVLLGGAASALSNSGTSSTFFTNDIIEISYNILENAAEVA